MGAGLILSLSRRRPWVFGWRAAAMGGGLWLAPLAMLGALPVGAWASGRLGSELPELLAVLTAGALALAAVDLWFRGLVHGILVLDVPVQRPGGPWLLSQAALVSALGYAVVAPLFAISVLETQLPELSRWELLGGAVVLAFATGLVLGVLRERTLSLWPGLLIQLLGIGVATGLFASMG